MAKLKITSRLPDPEVPYAFIEVTLDIEDIEVDEVADKLKEFKASLETQEQEEAPEEKPKKGKKAPVEPEEDPEEEDKEEEDPEEENEEEEKPKKASKTSSASSKAGKKTKASTYDRANETHKSILSNMLKEELGATWKKQADAAKAASIAMDGEDYLDNEGEMLEEFKTAFLKKLKAKSTSKK